MITVFILLQFLLLLFMVFHDWISIPPFNDIEALKTSDNHFYRILGSLINGLIVFFPLLITVKYYQMDSFPLSAINTICIFYFILSLGTILSWWVPYVFGSSTKHKEAFRKFEKTHHFLPRRGDNVIPNTLHVVLHLQVWACFAMSIYFFLM